MVPTSEATDGSCISMDISDCSGSVSSGRSGISASSISYDRQNTHTE